MLFCISVEFVSVSTISMSDHSILGPFSLLSVALIRLFVAGIRISGASDDVDLVVVVEVVVEVVIRGATLGTVVVMFAIGVFTVELLSVAIFSFIVDSDKTKNARKNMFTVR